MITFDTRGNDRQKEAAGYWCDDVTEQILYGGAKYGGKSVLGCSLIFGDALIYPNTAYFIARETLKSLKQFTLPSIHEVFDLWGLAFQDYVTFNAQDQTFHLYNGSRVIFLEAAYRPSDPEFHRFGSQQFTRGWCEEIGEMHGQAIKMLFLSVGRWKNADYGLKKKLLMTANPHKGYGYDHFYLPAKAGTLEASKKFVKALPQDNRAGDPDYIRSLSEEKDKVLRERLYLGNWEFDDDPTALCSYEAIAAIFDATRAEDKATMYLTADVARLGSDMAVVMVWRGWTVVEMYANDKTKLNDLQDAIEGMRKKWGIPRHNCIADQDGVGGGVVDNLGIKGFVNNASPVREDAGDRRIKPNYTNLQAQCGYGLADKINAFELVIGCEVGDQVRQTITRELEELKSAMRGDKRGLKSKDDVKAAIGHSPDYRDALLMRYYFELKQEHFMRPT